MRVHDEPVSSGALPLRGDSTAQGYAYMTTIYKRTPREDTTQRDEPPATHGVTMRTSNNNPDIYEGHPHTKRDSYPEPPRTTSTDMIDIHSSSWCIDYLACDGAAAPDAARASCGELRRAQRPHVRQASLRSPGRSSGLGGQATQMQGECKARTIRWTRKPGNANEWDAALGAGLRRRARLGDQRTTRSVATSYVVGLVASAAATASGAGDIRATLRRGPPRCRTTPGRDGATEIVARTAPHTTRNNRTTLGARADELRLRRIGARALIACTVGVMQLGTSMTDCWIAASDRPLLPALDEALAQESRRAASTTSTALTASTPSCGTQHGFMPIVIEVVHPETYAAHARKSSARVGAH